MNGDSSMNNFPITDKQPSKGPMLGTIIIVLIIIIGGIYVFSSRRATSPSVPENDNPIVNENYGEPTGNEVIPGEVSTPADELSALRGLETVEKELGSSESDLKNLENEIK